jgi:hypothetical protein
VKSFNLVDARVWRVDLLKFCSVSEAWTSVGSSTSSFSCSPSPVSLVIFSTKISLLSSLVVQGKTKSLELICSSWFSSIFLKKGSFSKKVTCLEI